MKIQKEDQILAYSGGLVIAVASGVVFLYSNFETRADHSEFKEDITARLVRIEGKLDEALQK